MRVDRSVSSGTRQVLVLSIRNVQVCLGVSVFLGKTEIDDVDLVASLSNTHQEVVGLDISVDKVSGVDVFDSRDELIGEEENGFEAELSVAKVEQILEGWSTRMSADDNMVRDPLTEDQGPWHCNRIRYRTIGQMVHRHLQRAICRLSTRIQVEDASP